MILYCTLIIIPITNKLVNLTRKTDKAQVIYLKKEEDNEIEENASRNFHMNRVVSLFQKNPCGADDDLLDMNKSKVA